MKFHKYGKLVTAIGVIGCAFITTPSIADCARIAYSRTTGDYGKGYESGYCSNSSKSDAFSKCGRNDCVIELTVQGECGALARTSDDYSHTASGTGSTLSSAGNNAIDACGSGCRLVTSACAD